MRLSIFALLAPPTVAYYASRPNNLGASSYASEFHAVRPVPSVDSTLQSTFDRMAPAGHPLSDPLAVFVGDLEASAAGTSLAQELASDASVTSSLEEQLRRAAALEASAEGPPVEDAVAAVSPPAPAAVEAAAPAPTCDKAAVVGELFQLWGSGKLDAAATERLTATDVVVDAKDGKDWMYTDGYAVYVGHAGFAAWLKFLTGIQFPDFAVHKMAENAAGTVDVAVSYTPTISSTGRSASSPVNDTHVWEVNATSCVVTKFSVHWGDAAALDALWEPASPPPAPVETTAAPTTAPACDKAAVVGELFQLWGSGKLDAAATERLTATDVVVDAKDGKDWMYTDGYAVYVGHAGFAAWLKFLTGIQFPDFAVHKMAENAAGTVDVAVSFTPTVIATGKSAAKTMEDSHEWEVDAASCKVTKVLFHWGDAAALDALFEAPPPAPEPSPLPSPSPAAAAEEPGSGDSATVESPEPATLEPVPVPAPVGGARPVTTVVDILADLEAAATAAPEPSPSPEPAAAAEPSPAPSPAEATAAAPAAEPSPEPAAPGGARPVAPVAPVAAAEPSPSPAEPSPSPAAVVVEAAVQLVQLEPVPVPAPSGARPTAAVVDILADLDSQPVGSALLPA